MRCKLWKKMIVLMLAAVMTINTAPAMAMSETSTKSKTLIGGGLSSMLTLDFSGLAQDYLERTIFLAIGKAIEMEGDSDLGKALTTAKKLMASPLGNSLSNITGLCEEMLQELAVIEAKLDECNEKMDDFAESQHYAAYQEKREKLIAFKDTYNELLNMFTGLLTAMDAYDKSATEENYKAVQLALEKVEAFYVENPNALNGEYTTLDFNFVNDLHGFLQLISPYLPSQGITANVYPSDADYWGENQGTTTYLDTVFVCLQDHYPFEHQILEEMKAACSEVAGIANLYLTVHRIYTEIGAQLLAYDRTLSEEQREVELNALYSSYQEHAYKMVRGIEQLCDLGDTYTDGYMTYLDTNATIEVDNTEQWYVKKDWSNNTYNYISLSEKQITDDFLEFYQVKVPGDNHTYAILKGVSANGYADGSELSNEDLVEIAAREVVVGVPTDFWSVSGDYLKLTKSQDSRGEYKYSMLSDAEELKSLISGISFDGHLYSYLQKNLNAADLPASSGEETVFNGDLVEEGMLVPLKTSLDDWHPSNIGGDMHMDLPAVNISMPLDPQNLNRSVVSMDAYAEIADENGNKTNPLIILKGSELSFYLQKEFDQSKGDVEICYEDGSQVAAYPHAGTSLIAKVRPHSGKTIKSIYLQRVDQNGQLITGEEPYYLAGGPNEESESLEEALEACQQDSEGFYHFNFTAPYVQAALCVEFTDSVRGETYTVTLNESEGGVLYFANGGMTSAKREFHTGEEVCVYLRPYDGYVCKGASPAISSSDQNGLFTPTMKVLRFKMTNHDVDVTGAFEKARLVDLDVVDGGEGCGAGFVYEADGVWDDSWNGSPGSFLPGDKVTIKFEETQKYYVSEVVIIDFSSNDYIVGDVKDNTVTFTMPDANVGVEVIYRQVQARNYTAELQAGGSGHLYFTDAAGNANNSVKDTFLSGSTVTFKAITEHKWDGVIEAKDYNGNDIEVTSLGDNLYSFVMPNANAFISTDFAAEITVTLSALDGVTAFYFVDSENHDKGFSYGPTATFYEGDQFSFGCYTEHELQDWERRVNEIYVKDSDGNDIAFEKTGTHSTGTSLDSVYTATAGDKDITISADFDTFRRVHLTEGYTEDNFGFRGGDGWFPGGPVYLEWTGKDSPADILVTAVDADGNEIEVQHNSPTSRYYTIYMPETDVYVTAEKCVDGVTISGRYQPPLLNKDGFYEIRNAGHLMWFNQLVNHVDPSAKAVLMNDIDMSDIKEDWKALGHKGDGYRGTFDGQSFTIHNLNLNWKVIKEFKEKHFAIIAESGVVKNVEFTFDTTKDKSTGGSVDTGDRNSLWAWMAVLAASAGSTAVIVKRRKMNKQ